MQQRKQVSNIDGVFGKYGRRAGEHGWPVRLSEHLHGNHRDPVLIPNSAPGPVIGHRDRFIPGDRPTTPPPQDQPRPERLTAPADHAGGHSEHQTRCGAGVSAENPSNHPGGQDTYG